MAVKHLPALQKQAENFALILPKRALCMGFFAAQQGKQPVLGIGTVIRKGGGGKHQAGAESGVAGKHYIRAYAVPRNKGARRIGAAQPFKRCLCNKRIGLAYAQFLAYDKHPAEAAHIAALKPPLLHAGKAVCHNCNAAKL